MSSRVSPSPELSVTDQLDDEIAKLKARVESLKNDVRLQVTTLMTADSTRQILESSTTDSRRRKLLAKFEEQIAHKQQCLYRACAGGITTFKVRDPDPNAVDGGNVLGLRFEVMSKAKFMRPYYVMLNRPYPNNKRALRVHRHTVPPFIPLSGLAARYLPPPTAKDEDEGRQQDLSLFARSLRRELVRYHNRAAVIGDLRKAVGLGSKKAPDDKDTETSIANVSLADAEAKQVTIEWRDGRTGRLVMDDDGEIVKMVVQGDNGQDRETVREFLAGATRVEEVSQRLGNG
ncbi:Cenp-O kinetochore centromere component-domain-containing protein [Poronia punctata]|nr:Cenp-O kinetochore centromere component-domain-containing protein [Poronia punctata]